MLNIEYEIKLNEHGRPYIELPDDYENKPEHKFFALEITRYLLEQIIAKRSTSIGEFNLNKIETTANLLGQVSDEIAEILFDEMKKSADNSFLIFKNYHFIVESVDELNKLKNLVVYDGKIFEITDGLKAFVSDIEKIYIFAEDKWDEIV